MLPDRRYSLELHRKYGSNQILVGHCEAVADAAKLVAARMFQRGSKVDLVVVTAGGLLHDIGRNKTQTVHHGHVGAEILEAEGVDGRVVEVVRRHVGAGISNEEARTLGFPEGDYIPRTIEERLVCFADKMADSSKMRPLAEEERRFIQKGHDVERLRQLKRGIMEELGEDPEQLILNSARVVRAEST